MLAGRMIVGIASLALAQTTMAAAQPPVVRLARDGRTLFVPARFDQSQPVQFAIEADSGPPECFSPRPEAGPLQIRYRFLAEPEQPDVLAANSAVGAFNGTVHLVPPSPVPARFLLFNVWEQSASLETEEELGRLRKCLALRRDTEVMLERLRGDVTAGTTAIENKTKEVERFSEQIREVLASIAAYQHIGGNGVDKVMTLQGDLANIRKSLATARQELETATRKLEDSKETLATEESGLGVTADQFIAATNHLSDFLAAKETSPGYYRALVLRVGGVLAHKHEKAVYYDLWKRRRTDVVAVSAMAGPPVVHYGDRLFAVLTNVVAESFDRPFAIRISEQAGAVINTAPVRPVFDPSSVRTALEHAGALPVPKVELASVVYRDVFLAVSGTFAPNDYAKVTIVTEANNAEGKPEEVKIVNEAKFPQFRALYRYNFNTGVIRSRLRSPTFSKVKIEDDKSETEKVNEARYRVDEDSGHTQVLPMFAFTFTPVRSTSRVP